MTILSTALPDRAVYYIFTGLLDTMNEADELAAVLCHEMAHVPPALAQRIEQGKRMSWAALAGMLAGAIIGGKRAVPFLLSA